ncbi:hypothetical protein PR202_ga02009 [Eleusine coracana subsp. coracana]|uniref:E3 ubiquitin-protein ligase PRT1 n=1 Tax=Eleusine coracana subsp. coracana TaxID=191504 RepID=A0AAV5BIR1_ELECO|nr:hypothetical protein PR202_ga01322 [Eleusine coracana subsp. coracana]GJM86176.1 hypothetical protein PR202_ga02009 [Eleusine coracana subsp. coracana]
MASDGNRPEPEKAEGASAPTVTGGDYMEDPQFQCCVCLDIIYKPVVLEEEKHMETYSPQIIEFYNSKNNEIGKDRENSVEDGKIRPSQEAPSNSNIVNEHSKKIKLEDVSCPLCKEMLYQPAVLNCGHVYCVSCLSSLNEEALKCQVCGGLHPGDVPNVCLDLDHFLEEYFPSEYESRGVKVQFEKRKGNHEASSSCTSTKENSRAEHNDDLSDVHFGVGCDSCGVYPIRGKRYKCQDCAELIGFDLCEPCYSSSLNLPGRFNQQHTPDHRMQLDDSNLLHRLLRFHGMPEDGQLMLQDVVINPVAMAEILGGNQEMEDDGEEAAVAPDAMIEIVIDNQEMEDNDEQDQPL